MPRRCALYDERPYARWKVTVADTNALNVLEKVVTCPAAAVWEDVRTWIADVRNAQQREWPAKRQSRRGS